MPRTARASVGGVCYHVMNRGNDRSQVFHDAADYEAFAALLVPSSQRPPMRLLAWCLMPNHFHMVLWPHADGDLGHWMRWLLTSCVRRHHRRHGTTGHVWQGRFKAFPSQSDEHLYTVLRYVEGNALRAGLVRQAEDWRWGRLYWRQAGGEALAAWPELVNRAMGEKQLTTVRRSVQRGSPFGSEMWIKRTAARLGLEFTLRPRGRPRKHQKS